MGSAPYTPLGIPFFKERNTAEYAVQLPNAVIAADRTQMSGAYNKGIVRLPGDERLYSADLLASGFKTSAAFVHVLKHYSQQIYKYCHPARRIHTP